MINSFRALVLALGFLLSFSVASTPAIAQEESGGGGFGEAVQDWIDNKPWFIPGGDDDEDPAKSYADWKAALADPGSCWGCTLYSHMASVTKSVGAQGQAVFAGGAASALSAFMGLWVVWQLYLLLSPSFANGPAQSIDTIFQKIVLMIILLWLLGAGPYSYIMEGFVFPALEGTMNSAMAIMGVSGGGCGGGGSGLGSGVGLICAMHIQMGEGLALGAFLIDDSTFHVLTGEWEVLQLLAGVILCVCFAWMMIMLPFRLFDAMIRLAVVSVILPVAILAYQFKPTRGFTKQAATSTAAAVMVFLFTAIAVAISVRLLEAVTKPIFGSVNGESTESYFGPLGGAEFMIVVAAAIGMAAFIKQAASLASEFAGFQGSMGNVGGAGGAAIAGAASVAAAGAAYGTGKVGMKAVSGTVGAGKAVMSTASGAAARQSDVPAGQAR